MILPNAVKKASETSEAIQKQLRDGKPDDQAGTTSQETPLPNSQDTLPNETVVTQTQKPVDTPTDPAPKEDEETYKQRYHTLKGKFDSEVPRLQHDVRNLSLSVSELQNKNEQLMEAANNQITKDPLVDDQGKTLDPEAFKQYGDEFGSLVETIQSVQAENATLKGQIQQLSGDVTQSKEGAERQRQTDHEVYMGNVKRGVAQLNADFETLNTDPAFLNFLRQHPLNESESRLIKLNRAEASLDLDSAVEIFKEYLGTVTPQPQDIPNPPAPNLQPAPQNTGTDLNPPAPSQNTRTWNRKEISLFYKDKAAGKYSGREDEANALEADIYLAQAQGRVVA